MVDIIELCTMLSEGPAADATLPGVPVREVLDGGDKLRPMDNTTTPTTDIEDEDIVKESGRLENCSEGMEREEGPGRMEMKYEKLRQKWAGTDYEIICERLEGMLDWVNEDGGREVKESLVDWLIGND